jgi:phenylpyruvate tautomerase PptA (4-oxalocrotonate tautomerase family)
MRFSSRQQEAGRRGRSTFGFLNAEDIPTDEETMSSHSQQEVARVVPFEELIKLRDQERKKRDREDHIPQVVQVAVAPPKEPEVIDLVSEKGEEDDDEIVELDPALFKKAVEIVDLTAEEEEEEPKVVSIQAPTQGSEEEQGSKDVSMLTPSQANEPKATGNEPSQQEKEPQQSDDESYDSDDEWAIKISGGPKVNPKSVDVKEGVAKMPQPQDDDDERSCPYSPTSPAYSPTSPEYKPYDPDDKILKQEEEEILPGFDEDYHQWLVDFSTRGRDMPNGQFHTLRQFRQKIIKEVAGMSLYHIHKARETFEIILKSQEHEDWDLKPAAEPQQKKQRSEVV